MLLVMGLVALYGTGLGVRRAAMESQYRLLGREIPFTLESAIEYRRVKMIFDTGHLPGVDTWIQYPEGITVRETYEFGSEYVRAALAKCFPSGMPVANRLRWIEPAWFSLGIPFLAIWLGVWRRNWAAGFVAGAFYAVTLSNVLRSTGHELSNENFALPLLLAHLAFEALAGAAGTRIRMWLLSVVSAVLLGLSLAWWDLIQYYVLLWAAFHFGRALCGRFPLAERDVIRWVLPAAVLVVVGALNPYYRAHAFLASPVMGLVYATALLLGWSRVSRPGVGRLGPGFRWAFGLLLALVPFALLSLLRATQDFDASYGHFVELLAAKIRFLNHKPADPSLLTFNQRIMWVPALNSADVQLTFALFPAILLLSFIALVAVFPLSRKQSDPRISGLLFSYVVSFLAFCFFVRFHVFLAIFSVALLGVWVSAVVGGGWKSWVTWALLGCGFLAEAGQVFGAIRSPERWGRANVYYKELVELADWLREHAAPEPVLANFGVSGTIAAYGKCPVVLHPKFESAVIRDRVRAYGEVLFKGTERQFRDWVDARGARYYVYSMGEFSAMSPELQMRYFVDALEPPAPAPARLFESNPSKLTYFTRLWGNRKYAVYEIYGRAREGAAAEHASEAQDALERGDLAAAQKAAETALNIDPRQKQAIRVLRHVMSLKEDGFQHRADETN
ncbi:MAG: hypothetical protein V1929_10660 [bacterium]